MGEQHDCLAVIAEAVSPRPALLSEPLSHPDTIFYVDGSARKINGDGYVGYAFFSDHEIIESARLPSHLYAQAAELFALTRTCILATGKSVTIFTDCRYCFGAVHDFGRLWKNKNFLTSQGKTIQHHALVNNLLEAILLPSSIAVCKCQAHSKAHDIISLQNWYADSSAKSAAMPPLNCSLQMVLDTANHFVFDPHMSLKDIQSMAPPVEKAEWKKRGHCDSEGVW